jgi:CysZ protein
MNQVFTGASYLFKGFGLINKKGIRPFAYIPMVINTLLFSIAIWFGYAQFDQWMSSLIPNWMPDWLLSVLMWIIWPLFTALIALVVFFTFSIIANILAAPFNGVLAEVVEVHLSGQAPTAIPWQKILKDAPLMIWNEIKKLLYVLKWIIPLFILSWIPVVNFIAPVLWMLFSSWMLAIDYHDYPMGNHQILFSEQRDTLKQHRLLVLGFGGATLAATMVPLINFIVIPAAVAGATALYLERVK